MTTDHHYLGSVLTITLLFCLLLTRLRLNARCCLERPPSIPRVTLLSFGVVPVTKAEKAEYRSPVWRLLMVAARPPATHRASETERL